MTVIRKELSVSAPREVVWRYFEDPDLPRTIEQLLGLTSSLKSCLEAVTSGTGRRFLIVIDAVNEFVGEGLGGRGMLWREINSLVERLEDFQPRVKCLVSTRSDTWFKDFPRAEVAYEIPNATVGYQLGYGVVVNVQRPGSLSPSRAVVIAAVKNDVALVATGEGPFRRFTPDFGPGMPSAANVAIAMDMSKYIDSFNWRGDPPR